MSAAAVATAVRERPVIFGPESVRAILSGSKTQTRRVVAPANAEFGSAPRDYWPHGDFDRAWVDGSNTHAGYPRAEYLHVPVHADAPSCTVCKHYWWKGTSHRLYSRVQPAWPEGWDSATGQEPPPTRLWVRETWGFSASVSTNGHERWLREQDGTYLVFRADDEHAAVWRSPIHMPRWASRLTLEVTEVRVQRLQDISEEDARAEGFPPDGVVHGRVNGEPAVIHYFNTRDWFGHAWSQINGKRAPWSSNPWVWAISFRRLA